MTQASTDAATDFDAAKKVHDALKELPKPGQIRVLRWVAESLGIVDPTIPTPAPPSPAPPPPPPPPAGGGTETTLTDIKSFIAAKKPRSDIQFVTAVAYFYKFNAPTSERLDAITAETAKEATRLADWDRTLKARHALNNAKLKGYLNSRARGEFVINGVGENLVARSLPGDGGGGSSAPAKKTAKKKTAKKKKKAR